MELRAYCERCGLLFPTGLPVGIDSWGSSNTTDCPRCGGSAVIEDWGGGKRFGWPSLRDIEGVLRTITPDDVSNLIRLAEQLRSGEIKREEGVRAAAAVSQPASAVFDWATMFGFLSLVIAILAYVQAVTAEMDNDKTDAAIIDELKGLNRTNQELLTELRRYQTNEGPPPQKVPKAAPRAVIQPERYLSYEELVALWNANKKR